MRPAISNDLRHAPRRAAAAFTLLEMIVVIGIIGIMAALALPSLRMNKGNVMIAATRQMTDDLALARLRAINGRTKVYVVFFPSQSVFGLTPAQTNFFVTNQAANQIMGAQFSTYALFTFHSVGDQPGQTNARYLTEWKTLPEGVFIATNAFADPNVFLNLVGTDPFQVPYVSTNPMFPVLFLPYIAFDSQGKLLNRTADVRIPLTVGSIFVSKDSTGNTNVCQDPDVVETPPGNSTNNYNRIVINWLTGRTKIERPELP